MTNQGTGRAGCWDIPERWTYGHELLQLLSLHARSELALFRGVESKVGLVSSEQGYLVQKKIAYPSIVMRWGEMDGWSE